MEKLFNSVDIEKKIKSKVGSKMSKQQLNLSMGYLDFKYQNAMIDCNEEKAKIYLDFMDVVQRNYDKFKNEKYDNESELQ